ncbi:MAG: hypothetical protein LBH25_03405 [Fibromonadaceae bacterium]|jgi:hypothetical protein|nr:hypothetical protein [Fibromonadaceae bacterium]
MNAKHFFLLTSMALAMMFTVSCSSDADADPLETDEFYFHGGDSFKVINASDHDITSVVIRSWNGADLIEYDKSISKKGDSRLFTIPPDEVLPRRPLMCVKAENRPKLDCIEFYNPSYTWDGKDLYITRLPHPLKLESL